MENPTPMILWNAKDDPTLNSGYGIITRHLVPRLADHYGQDKIVIYAPIYNRDRIYEWQGIRVVPGTEFNYGENLVLDHYREYNCNLLIQVGDAWPLGALPDMAAVDQLTWIQWLAVDWVGMPNNITNRIRTAAKLIPFSKYGYDLLIEGGLGNVGPPIWLGLDLDIWKPMDRESIPGIMSSLGYSYDTFNVLIVGANQQRKRIREALEAVSVFLQANPDVNNVRIYLHSHMLGERDFHADLDELQLKSIICYPEPYVMTQGGFPEEHMAMVFNCADVVINLALEGFGLVYTQAQACGVPVIYMGVGSGPELVQNGYEVPPAGQETSAHQMTQALPNTISAAIALGELYAQRMKVGQPIRSRRAIDWTRENLGWDNIAQLWIGVIDQAMEDRRKYCYDEPEVDHSGELWAKAHDQILISYKGPMKQGAER